MAVYIVLPILALLIAVVFVIIRVRGGTKAVLGDSLLEDYSLIEVRVPKNDNVSADSHSAALASEHMFASLHGLLREESELQEHLSFEIESGPNGIRFYVAVPNKIRKFVESQIYAHYPTAKINVVEDYLKNREMASSYSIATLYLTREQFFPIKTYKDFETDTLSSLTSAVAESIPGEEFWMQVLVRPVADIWQQEGYDFIEAVKAGTEIKKKSDSPLVVRFFSGIIGEFMNLISTAMYHLIASPGDTLYQGGSKGGKDTTVVKLTATQELELKGIENKLSKMGYEVLVRVYTQGNSEEHTRSNLRAIVAAMKQFSSTGLNSFTSVIEDNNVDHLNRFKNREFIHADSYVLNIEELASIYHFPSSVIETPNISWIYSKSSEPPSSLPTDNCTYMAETIYRNKQVTFGLKNGDDRLRHMYAIGKTGTGKSTLFELMISQDIANGHGVGVLDPHGELVEKALEYIPEDRLKDVVIVDPSDTEKPVGINLLEFDDPSQKNLMASALVSAVKQHFEYSWGPRLEYLLNYAILTLLEVPGTSILGITRLLEDQNYLKYILHFVKDPVVIRFWEQEFKNMKGNQKLVTEAISPIQNKINRFLSSTTIRNILGQRNSTIDMWDIMNSGKILLMNLSKGKIGKDNADLLGSLLISRLQFMALQRAKIPSGQRRPFYLYVDEFQNFASGTFEEILSESRKYGLGLYLTHQFTAQLPEQMLKAVFGNVGTIVTFGLGAPDARVMESEMAPYFDQQDIISLERFNIYVKMMIDGMTSHPFSARILLPWKDNVVPKTNNRDRALEMSRENYGTDRQYVEDKISKWVETQFDKGLAIALEHKKG